MHPEETSAWRVFSCEDKEGMGAEVSPEDSSLLSQEHGEGDANRCSGEKGDPRPTQAKMGPPRTRRRSLNGNHFRAAKLLSTSYINVDSLTGV